MEICFCTKCWSRQGPFEVRRVDEGVEAEEGAVIVDWAKVLECGVKVVVIKKKHGCEAYQVVGGKPYHKAGSIFQQTVGGG